MKTIALRKTQANGKAVKMVRDLAAEVIRLREALAEAATALSRGGLHVPADAARAVLTDHD